MKILWLAPYPIKLLCPEIKTVRIIETHPSSWIVNLSNELSKQKNINLNILTYSPIVPFSQTIIKGNITFHIIKYSVPFTNRGFPWYMPLDKLFWYNRLIRKALKIIKSISPDIIHAYGTENAYALLANKANYPYIISIQGIIKEIYKISPSASFLLQKPIEKYVIKKSKYFDCRTNWDTNNIKWVNSKAKIYQILRVVNPVFFNYSWKENNQNTILFIGSLIRRKGIETLIKAFAIVNNKFQNVDLKIIGGGSKKYTNYLSKIALELNIYEKITWLGQLSPNEIATQLSNCKIFVLPTLVENSPNTLAEAMTVGTPSIASNVGGIPSMIDNGYNGILFKSESIHDLSNKIIQLLNNKDKLNKLSKNAKITAINRNKTEDIVEKVLGIYKEIIQIEK